MRQLGLCTTVSPRYIGPRSRHRIPCYTGSTSGSDNLKFLYQQNSSCYTGQITMHVFRTRQNCRVMLSPVSYIYTSLYRAGALPDLKIALPRANMVVTGLFIISSTPLPSCYDPTWLLALKFNPHQAPSRFGRPHSRRSKLWPMVR